MGRVRKYKKYKSCDPYAKKKKATVDDRVDEPPDLFEAREHADRKRKERRFDDENVRELLLQREAVRSLKEEEKKKAANDRKIEGKKESESMKDFKTRVRQETRKTLQEELKNMTSTAKKRKERLKERKAKRKGLPGKVNREEIEEGFSCSADGRLRPSDLGGNDEFAKAPVFKFGERADRPPDFKGLLKFTEKPMRLKQQQEEENRATKKKRDDGGRQDESSQKKHKKISVTDIANGDDGLGFNVRKVADGIIHAGNGTGRTSASVEEMEVLRQRVQAAYRAVQEKRRAER